ncbi:RNA polymerase III transcription factor tfiiic [Apiospora arundinis]
MAGKHDSATATEPSWRPFAQKLSGFMRHGSTKNRKVSPSQPVVNAGDDKISVFKLGRNRSQKSPPAETTVEFKPLEVDISKLESIRLAEGWLEVEQPKKPDPEQLKKKPLPKPPPSSATPIADLFASKSDFDLPGLSGQDRGRRHTHMFLGSSGTTNEAQSPIARKPVPTSPAATTTTITSTTTATTTKPPATHAATYSILERGRPIEPKDIIPDTTADADADPEQCATPSSWSNATGASKWAGKNDNRHSMFAIVPTPTGNTRIDVASRLQTPRSASATPLDRIQAWQKSITSAPMAPAGSMAPPPVPNAALGTPQASASVRKVSPRGLAGNRLAWIRELEEKKSSDLRKDVGVLKKQAGSVSDKLAMFETKGTSNGGVGRLPPLSRSNSTTSRMSSVGLKSTTTSSAWDNTAATPRTSIDTTRSSHRNSGVLSYYDESFREKMEGLVAGLAEKEDEKAKEAEAVPRKRRITASFVSVEGKKGIQAAIAASAATRDAQPDAEQQEAKKEEEPVVATEAPAAEAQEEVPAQDVETATKTEEAEVAAPAVEAEEIVAPVVQAEKAVEETTPEPAQVEEVTPEVPAQAEEVVVEAEELKVSEPEVVVPEVAEVIEVEKVAEELPAQEEPVVSQSEPEVAAEQVEPVEETVVAEPVEQVTETPAVVDEVVAEEIVPVIEEPQKELIKDVEAPVSVQEEVQEVTPEAGAKIDI